MTKFTADSKVLIVGGGPGGLALAQILRANGIAFEVFERETDFNTQRQGWSFGLMEALDELPPLLPDDLGDIHQVSINHDTGKVDAMTIIEPKTANVMGILGNRSEGQPGHMIRGVRKRLRSYLSQHITVRTGKEFSHYEESEKSVTAFFRDGTSSTGSILIAADGAHSKVRAQLLSDPTTGADHSSSTTPQLSNWVAIFGECLLPKAVYAPLHNLSSAGLLTATDTLRFQMSPTSFDPSGLSANYYWAVCFPSPDPAADSAWIQHANAQSLYSRAVALTTDVSPLLTDVIRCTGPAGMVTRPPRFVEWVPPRVLPRGRVTLLGDAAHTMTPFKGAGANTAIRDACDLARLLVDSVKRTDVDGAATSVEWLLRRYEDVMLKRGREMVLATRESGRDASGVMDALHGRINTHVEQDNHANERRSAADGLGNAQVNTTVERVAVEVN